MSTPDVFQDMLVGQEQVLAVLGAPGVPSGGFHSWWQVALTQFRVLVVKLRTREGTQNWVSEVRWAKNRSAVQIAQYPRTNQSDARLEFLGFPSPVVLREIDSPDLHAHLQPFLEQWGQPVAGTDSVPVREPLPDVEEGTADRSVLLFAVIGGLAFVIFCCGCSSLLVLFRDALLGLLA